MICLRHSGRRASRSRLLLYYPRTAADKQTVRWRDQRGEARRPGSSTSPACAQQRHHRLSTANQGARFSCTDLGTLCNLQWPSKCPDWPEKHCHRLKLIDRPFCNHRSERASATVRARVTSWAMCAPTGPPAGRLIALFRLNFPPRGKCNCHSCPSHASPRAAR